jgi:hypothetical protein
VEYLAAFRLGANRFDDGLQSTSFDSRCPLYRKAASGRGEMGSEGGVGPADDLRIEIRMRSTASEMYSVRMSWSTWRILDLSAAGSGPRIENLESCVEWVPRPRRGRVFFDYETGGIAVLLSRR